MTELTINFIETEERFPLYCKYPLNAIAQRAYISLNLETGEVDAAYFPSSSSYSPDQFHNVELTFPVSCQLKSDYIVDIIKEHIADFQFILDNSEVVFIDSNKTGLLNANAQKRFNNMPSEQTGFIDGEECFMIDDLADFLQSNIFPYENVDVDSFIKEVFSYDGDENYYYSDELNSEEAIKKALTAIWLDRLYCNESLTKTILVFLQSTGKVIGAWNGELDERLKEHG